MGTAHAMLPWHPTVFWPDATCQFLCSTVECSTVEWPDATCQFPRDMRPSYCSIWRVCYCSHCWLQTLVQQLQAQLAMKEQEVKLAKVGLCYLGNMQGHHPRVADFCLLACICVCIKSCANACGGSWRTHSLLRVSCMSQPATRLCHNRLACLMMMGSDASVASWGW